VTHFAVPCVGANSENGSEFVETAIIVGLIDADARIHKRTGYPEKGPAQIGSHAEIARI
jgi:hypothetical protein